MQYLEEMSIPSYSSSINDSLANLEYAKLPISTSIVELPCFVEKAQTAFSILGQDNVESNATCIQLRFPSSDPLRQYILGCRETACGLLVRVKRMRSKSSSESYIYSEVIGGVESSFQFSQPADYQVNLTLSLIHSLVPPSLV